MKEGVKLHRYRNEDTNKYIIGMILLAYIISIVFLNIIIPDKSFSDMENRRLEQAPEFSFEKLFDGKYTSNCEKYISDQFPFRDFYMGVKSDCERFIGKKENNDVFLGEDGYLLEKFKKPDDKDFKKQIDAINVFAKNNPDVNKYFILAPNSVKVLEEKLPTFAPVDDELLYINKVKNNLDESVHFVNIYDTLSSKKNEYIYYKTDHHWTTKGAFYAYEKLGESMEFKPNEKNYFDIRKVTDSFYGSLYSKAGVRKLNPDSIELYIPKNEDKCKVEYCDEGKAVGCLYNMKNLNKKDKYTVFFDGNHPLVKISTNVSNNKKLLVVKDSYANSFVPFLTGHFSEIYMVDLRYFSDDLSKLIKDKAIDDILILYNVKSFFEDKSVEKISW